MKSIVSVINHETCEAFEQAVLKAYKFLSRAVPTEEKLQSVVAYANMVFNAYGKDYAIEIALIDDARLLVEPADGTLRAVATCEGTDYGLPRLLENALQLIGFKHEVVNTVDMRIIQQPENTAPDGTMHWGESVITNRAENTEHVNRLIDHVRDELTKALGVESIPPEGIQPTAVQIGALRERASALIGDCLKSVTPKYECSAHTVGRHEVVQTKRGPHIHVFSEQTGLLLETYKLRGRRGLKKKIRDVTSPCNLHTIFSLDLPRPVTRITMTDTIQKESL